MSELRDAAERWRQHMARRSQMSSPYYATTSNQEAHQRIQLARDTRLLSDAYIAAHDERELTPELFREVTGCCDGSVLECRINHCFHLRFTLHFGLTLESSFHSSRIELPHVKTVWQLKTLLGLLTGKDGSDVLARIDS